MTGLINVTGRKDTDCEGMTFAVCTTEEMANQAVRMLEEECGLNGQLEITQGLPLNMLEIDGDLIPLSGKGQKSSEELLTENHLLNERLGKMTAAYHRAFDFIPESKWDEALEACGETVETTEEEAIERLRRNIYNGRVWNLELE